MFLPANNAAVARAAILLLISWTSLAAFISAASTGLNIRSLQGQEAHQCDSLCTTRHAEDAAECRKWYGPPSRSSAACMNNIDRRRGECRRRPPSRLFAACTNNIDRKRDECQGRCDANASHHQNCLQTCHHQLPDQLRACDSSTNDTTGCTSRALIRAEECQSRCGVQYELQSQTATDRDECYTLALEYTLRDVRECMKLDYGVKIFCQTSCIKAIHVSSDYCNRTFPVDEYGNPPRVHPVRLELPACTDAT